MKYWLTTDTHFNHVAKMQEYCNRPADYEERIQSDFVRLTSSDVLIHLGDVCIGKDTEAHEKYIIPVKAKKILVRGNHDGKSSSWYMEHGWDWVCNSMTIRRYHKTILLSHMPMVWDGYWDINIHGHFHNTNHRRVEAELSKDILKGQKLLALEYNNYQLWNLDKILEDLNENNKE